MKGLFIVNPSSGRQNNSEKLEAIAGKLIMDRICNTIDVFYTKKQNDARNKAAGIKEGDYDFVVAAGGDGTLNEVVSGIVTSGSNTPLAVISAGTVNDFSTYMGLPQEVDQFCNMIKKLHSMPVDVGLVNGVHFINVVAAGVFSDIGFSVDKDSKAAFGKLAYYLEGAAELPAQLGSSFRLKFITDDMELEKDVMLFMVTNTQSVGGFREIAPHASVQDGLLDVVVIKKMDLILMLPLMVSLLQGQHVNHPAVEYMQTTSLRIEKLSEEKLLVDYDGELLEDDFPIEIKLIPAGIRIIIPEEEK